MKKRKLVAVLLGIVCSIGLLACGNAEGDVAGGNVSDGNVLVSEDSVASDMSAEPVSEMDVEASEEEKLFDTSAFDPTLFDEKWVFGDVEVTLPLGSISDIHALGVDIEAFGLDMVKDNALSDTDFYVNADVCEPMIAANSKEDIIEMRWGFIPETTDGGSDMDIYMYGDAWFMNDTESEVNILDVDVDYFAVNCINNNLAAKLSDVLGMECDTLEAFNADAVVARFGQPLYYNEETLSDDVKCLRLFYCYGDYTLFFVFKTDYANQYVLQGVCYVTQSYMEEDARVFDFYTEYLEVCEEYK